MNWSRTVIVSPLVVVLFLMVLSVPAFVNWPGTLERRRVTQPVHVVDWMPTLANLVGAVLPEGPRYDGEDIWNSLSTDAAVRERTFYITWSGTNRVALRRGKWKILRNGRNAPWMLFDLNTDPFEATDLKEDQPDKFSELMGFLEAERAFDAP